ncbi:hypothetical protein [Absidia glauca]|uniref:Uncharacterized protein n=1 Tax=Absidia glauca TaxID=4829 RepID=A0A168S612_ABSGL|nr:hypothetical protein [Absidia glauca]
MKSWLSGSSSTSPSLTTTNTLPVDSPPSSSCFQSPYTIQSHQSPSLTPGIPLIRMDECLGFANSINSNTTQENVWFHTYWPAPFNDAQLLSMLRSFSATQAGRIKIWIRDQHQETMLLRSQAWQLATAQRQQTLTFGRWSTLTGNNEEAYNMDYIGMLILQQYGGVWFHPSIVFMRDWSALVGGKREWMIQHDCQATHTGSHSLIDDDRTRRQQRHTLMHFFPNSTLLCHLIDTAANEGAAVKRIDFGKVYRNAYRDLMKRGVRPWSLLPWCLMNAADGCDTADSNAFQLFEIPKGGTARLDGGIFALQYDLDKWTLNPGSLLDLLDQSHRTITGW